MERMKEKILITGSEGLIGNRVRRDLVAQGYDVVGLDLRPCTFGTNGTVGNIMDPDLVKNLAADCSGIIHLAAVSRVIDGQKDPALCHAVNVEGTNNILSAALKANKNPWIIYASSREVYGDVYQLSAKEDTPIRPVNIYGRSKAEAEDNVHNHFAKHDARGVVLRFSNVYGDVAYDYADRVVPAFAGAVALGRNIRIDGSGNSFDFTHLHDTASGILKVVDLLGKTEKSLAPIHFLTGRETTLGELADLACSYGIGSSQKIEAPSRDYDVSNFYGSPQRAKDVLGWVPSLYIEEGLRLLVEDFKKLRVAA